MLTLALRRSPDLLPFLREQIEVFNRDPSQIELELTERTVVVDIEQTLNIMRQLKAMGFTFSIDDSGSNEVVKKSTL